LRAIACALSLIARITRHVVDETRSHKQNARMRDRERRARLIELLRAGGQATVIDLATTLGVTASTIRRDLDRLARDGRLVRTHGGAMLAGQRPARPVDPQLEAKRGIARAAAALVADHTTIAIGSGSTALAFAQELASRRLTVITNALDVANALVDREGIELIILGGVVRPGVHSMLGHLAELASAELRADTLFMGIGAVSVEQGLMNDSVPEILTDRALRRMSRSVVVLADATKFEQVAPGFVMGLEEVDVLVTDDGAPATTLAQVEEQGVRVVVAGRPGGGAAMAVAAAAAGDEGAGAAR
jgi:DeoR/GlpR family transcriptional regulator of sugar metabolism